MSTFDIYDDDGRYSIYRRQIFPRLGIVEAVLPGFKANIRLQTGEYLYNVPYTTGAIHQDGSAGHAHGRLGGLMIGHTVIVQFLDGIITRPIITGTLPATIDPRFRKQIENFSSSDPAADQPGTGNYRDWHHSGYSVSYETKRLVVYHEKSEIFSIDFAAEGQEKISISKSGVPVLTIDCNQETIDTTYKLIVHNEIQADTDVKTGAISLKNHTHSYTDTPAGPSVTSQPQ